ncbi:MAG: SDR family NAD(P)-dependent oxidoreductase [Candidatus Shapirobacteria bacterium]|jgi:3-oxoacyl-[acyl-carrier protein] reductase|nr:SDR family NAD(P)-dependent oxidoreductase [Candidatus Shapirobacteria bacterium]
MKNRFTGKKIVILGGSSGIGLATAIFFNKYGAKVIIVSRDAKKLKIAKKNFKTGSTMVHTIVGDVSDPISMKHICNKIKDKFGKINYLVNAAGVSILQKPGIVDADAFLKLIEVNLKSVYLSSMHFGYGLLKNGGAIVNISSVRGRTGTSSFSQGYAVAKAGVINLTKTFAIELASKKIRVNCVAPGAIYPTGMSKSWSKKLREDIAEGIPLGRLGKPQEVAKVILFLLSEDASYITGQTIDVNGGQWMN